MERKGMNKITKETKDKDDILYNICKKIANALKYIIVELGKGV